MERAHFRRQAETSDAQLVPTRPTGVLLRLPGLVGNPAADTVTYVNPSTTLIPKTGVLEGGTPKCPFAYFSGMGKVGPRRVSTLLYRQDRRQKQVAPGRETLRPRRVGTLPIRP